MYKNGKYRETDKMSDLICENYPMVLVMSRFGIALGFGEKNIGEVCRQNGVDACTFLTVVNFLTEEISAPVTNVSNCLSIEALITYLHNAHDYFLNFRSLIYSYLLLAGGLSSLNSLPSPATLM